MYDLDRKTEDQIAKAFTYHAPKDSTQQERYAQIRGEALAFAAHIAAFCPNSRERSLALTKLEEVVMWANASIARNE